MVFGVKAKIRKKSKHPIGGGTADLWYVLDEGQKEQTLEFRCANAVVFMAFYFQDVGSVKTLAFMRALQCDAA
ncbi:MAG: hypothetical protein IJ599_04035 [Alphaproteobacteria bacterium]|nr:hypothetical protein [Alphaproteobacteria bacterium]